MREITRAHANKNDMQHEQHCIHELNVHSLCKQSNFHVLILVTCDLVKY